MTVGLTIAVYWSAKMSFIHVIAGTALAWTSYLHAHKLDTGRMVDKSARFRESNKDYSWKGIVGLIIMFGAFPGGILAVNQGSFYLLLATNSLFIGGYIVGHYGFTNELL